MKRLTHYFVTGIIALVAMIGVSALATPAYATSPSDQVQAGIDAADPGKNEKGCGTEAAPRKCTLGDTVQTVINVLLFIIGAVAVIMIIIGGIKYTISNGDSSQITSAKNTILYAVIGLVVALLAYAIVNFVVGQFA